MERSPAQREVAAAALGGLTVIALTVFLRRTLSGPLRDLPAAEAAAYTAAFSFAAALSVRPFAPRQRPNLSAAAAVAAFVLSLLFAAGLTTAAVAGLACLLSSAVVIGALTTVSLLPQASLSGASLPATPRPVTDPTALREGETPPAPPRAEAVASTGETQSIGAPAADLPILQLTRTVEAGDERITGLIRFEIPAGDIVAVLHVPLWPPLSSAPTVACELEGLDGRVRVPLARQHGFRIEVRIPEPLDEPLEGAVRFTAECRAASAAA